MDGLTIPPGSSVQVFTAEERPDLWQQARPLFGGVWPEYNLHGNHSGKYFGELFPRYARFQVLVYDGTADRVGDAAGPFPSGGTSHWTTCLPGSTPSACAPCRNMRRRQRCPR